MIHLARLYHALTAPAAAVGDPAVGRRLRVLAVGSLFTLVMGLSLTTATLVFTPDSFMGDPVLVYGAYGFIALLYAGSRSRWWRPVLWLFALGGTAAIWAMLSTSANGDELMIGLILSLLPFALASMVPARLAPVAVLMVSIAGAVYTYAVVPDLDGTAFGRAVVLALVVGLVIIGLQELARADHEELVRRAAELEEAWQQTEEARASRGRFLAKVQHELRTPLNGVIGAAQVLQEVGTDPLVLELAQAVRDSGDRLAFLVEDVLAFVAGNADEIELIQRPTAVPELVRELADRSRDEAERNGVALKVDAADMPRLSIDASRVGHVVGHLIRNAVRYAPKGQVRVEAWWRGGELVIGVHDTGRGMAQRTLESAFEPMAAVDEVQHQDGEGMGLGLATSRMIARAMGGSLTAASQLGEGSTFWLKIPAEASQSWAAA